MKCSLKYLGQIQCAKVPHSFFNLLTWGQLCPSPYSFFSRQAISPSQ